MYLCVYTNVYMHTYKKTHAHSYIQAGPASGRLTVASDGYPAAAQEIASEIMHAVWACTYISMTLCMYMPLCKCVYVHIYMYRYI